VTVFRRSLRGLSPLEARIDLQMLQDSWRTSPSSLVGQFVALVVLLWMTREWPVLWWQWAVPAVGLLAVWLVVVQAVQRFRRFGIAQSGYTRWRSGLLAWHTVQSLCWGGLAMALLDVASLE
jgi:two-component system, sensor histidine kinase